MLAKWTTFKVSNLELSGSILDFIMISPAI